MLPTRLSSPAATRAGLALFASALLTPALSASEASFELDALAALGLFEGDVVQVDLNGAPGLATTAALRFEGAPLTLALQPSDPLADGFQLIEVLGDGSQVLVPTGVSRTYRGTALEHEGALVAASWLEDGLYGRVRLADGSDLWIQPLLGVVEGASPLDHVVYRSDDIAPSPFGCAGAPFAGAVAGIQPEAGDPGTFAAGGGGLAIAELGIDADFEYYQDYGSNSTTTMDRIVSVIDTMNLQYESEVGITHEITTILVRTTSNDPYSSTDAFGLLDQFLDEWNNNQGSIQRDVAQLFTGKSIDGGTIGIAYVGVICNGSFGYGLVESDFNGNFGCATDLSAHELGHNWDADHCTCTSNTMNPFITCANTFNAALTVPSIESHRDSRTCLDTGGTAPTADFTSDVTTGAAPLTVNFTDTSSGSGISVWNWTFGDGATSTAQNPSHVYAADGTYDVSLTVTNGNGSDGETKFGYIVVDSGGGTLGTITKYGEDEGGANIGTLCSDSDPIAGTTMVFDVSGIPNGTSGFLWITNSQTNLPFRGGTLLAPLSGAPFRLTVSLSGGAASISFAIPAGASGVTAFSQGGFFDTTQSQGVALTNGLQIDVF